MNQSAWSETKIQRKLEAKDVIPNINHTGREGPKNAVFLSWWPSNSSERGTKRLPCEFGANPFSSSGDISYTNKTRAQQLLRKATVWPQ